MVVCNPAGPGRSRGSTPPEARMSDNTDDDYDDKINPADAQVGVDLSMWNYGLITRFLATSDNAKLTQALVRHLSDILVINLL